MKLLAGLFVALFSQLTLAQANFPVQNFKYISEFDYAQEVEASKQYVVMIFSSSKCLEDVIVSNTCLLFEKKLDTVVPSFRPSVKVVGFNTYFDNYQLTSQFVINKFTTVIIMKDRKIVKRIEANPQRDLSSTNALYWQDQLLRETVEAIRQIQ